MRVLYLILALIGACNISASIFITMARIEKADKTPKGMATALYFVFTVLGIYAARALLL